MSYLVQWVIEWSNRRRTRKGHPGGKDLAGLALRRNVCGENLAVVPQGLHAREAEHVQSAAHFVSCFAERQPRFARDEPGEFLALRFQGHAGLLEDLEPLIASGRGPKSPRRTDRRIDILT